MSILVVMRNEDVTRTFWMWDDNTAREVTSNGLGMIIQDFSGLMKELYAQGFKEV